jgi:phosphate transport system substrate-binding protein
MLFSFGIKMFSGVLLTLVAYPKGEASASQVRLVLTGSSTVAPLVNEIGKRFEKSNPGIRVDVQSGGSSRGMNDVRAGLADIGMISRALRPDESDLSAHIIAIDGIGMIIHKANAVQALSDAQIKDIYSGKIVNWKSVGGEDRRITVVNKAEGRSTLELFLNHYKLLNREIKAQVVIGENQQAIKTVAGNRGALAYVSIGAAEFEARGGANIRLLSSSSVPATLENVRTGKFMLTRPLNLVTKGKMSDLASRFVQFSKSNEVKDLIDAQFFVSP